jgi:hypothetical protein
VASLVDELKRLKQSLERTGEGAGHLVPSTYPEVVNLVNAFSSLKIREPVRYDVCPADCVIFTDAQQTHCPNPGCGEARYFDNTKRPRRPFYVLSPVPVFRAWFGCPRWRVDLQYQCQRQQIDGELSDVQDGDLHKHFISLGGGAIPGTKIKITCGLGCDGKSRMSDSYSVSCFLLSVSLFHSKHRNAANKVLCVGVIPGPGHNHVETFGRVIISQFNQEFLVYDMLINEWRLAKILIYYVLVDTKAIADFTDGMQYPSAVACHMCKAVGSTLQRERRGTNMYYMGSWRHLADDDPVRQICARHQFPGVSISEAPPQMRTTPGVLLAGRIGEASNVDVDSSQHPSRRLHQKKRPWPSACIPNWRHDMVCVDSGHQTTNSGLVFTGCATCTGFGRVDEAVVEMEVARGRFADFVPANWIREKQPVRPPWAMTKEQCRDFTREITSIRIPWYHGGRLRAFTTPGVTSQLKMHSWRVILSELGIWAMHKAGAWRHDARYLELWTDEFRHISDLRRRSLTRDQLGKLETLGFHIHARKELLLPTRCMTWTSHYNTHMARFRQLLGGDVNMFRDERANFTVFNGGHSTTNLELSIMKYQALRDVAAFQSVSSPELFDESDADCHDLLGGGHLLPWRLAPLRRYPFRRLTLLELRTLEAMYAAVGFDAQMRVALQDARSRLRLGDLRRTRETRNIRVADARWRRFRVAVDPSKHPWQHGQCTLEWKARGHGQPRYGVIKRIFTHSVYAHALSPIALVFEVVQCISSESSPLTRMRMDVGSTVELVLAEDVEISTAFFLPAIPSDAQLGWTHNVVVYRG